MKTELEERLKQEAQIQAQEARSHRATVREIYQAVTGRTGEPGDWNGAIPVLALIEERDTLSAQVREIPDLLTIAHMQGSEQAKDRVAELTAERDRYRAACLAVREEISGCLKRDTDAFAQMTLDQIEHWNVSRHMQSHGYCLDQIDTAINPPKEA